MRRPPLVLACLLCAAASAALADPGLAGAWRLVSVDTVRPSGEVIHPFYGAHPAGLLLYDRSGWMSVQIVSDPKPELPGTRSREAFQNAPSAQKAAVADGYYAYYGPYTVDEQAATVTHHLRDSLYPGERGVDFVRHYAISGELLTLTAKVHEMGEDRERRLTWRRLGPSTQ
jgi:hypothetical protein